MGQGWQDLNSRPTVLQTASFEPLGYLPVERIIPQRAGYIQLLPPAHLHPILLKNPSTSSSEHSSFAAPRTTSFRSTGYQLRFAGSQRPAMLNGSTSA